MVPNPESSGATTTTTTTSGLLSAGGEWLQSFCLEQTCEKKSSGVDDKTFPWRFSPDNSFFNDLKARVNRVLRRTPNYCGPTRECVWGFYLCVASYFLCFGLLVGSGLWLDEGEDTILCCYSGSSIIKLCLAVCTGCFGAILLGFGHNWAHQPAYHSWAWVLDLEGTNSQDWFVAHDLTHHMYTNLPSDQHYRILEPFIVTDPHKPRQGAFEARFFSHPVLRFLWTVLVFSVGLIGGYGAMLVQMTITAVTGNRITKADPHHPHAVDFHWGMTLFPLQLVVLLLAHPYPTGLVLFIVKSMVASEWYLTIAFLNHNSEHAWSLKKRAKARDWGEAQLCASSDLGAPDLSFLKSVRYLWLNYHTVHHLFPMIDMSKHRLVQRVLEEVCAEHGIEYCRGKGVAELYAEMLETFKEPRDLMNHMREVIF